MFDCDLFFFFPPHAIMAVAASLPSRPALRVGILAALGVFFFVVLFTFYSDTIRSPVEFVHRKAQQYCDSSQET
jgi:hypothetical protein